MAPSTATPTDLHRASVACLQCRKAKVRCLVTQRLDQCNRCLANNTGCVFTQAKRTRARPQPYPQPPLPPDVEETTNDGDVDDQNNGSRVLETSHSATVTINQSGLGPAKAPTQVPPADNDHGLPEKPGPIITDAIRSRLIATLSSLRNYRGAPFSFITAEGSPVQHQRSESPRTPHSLTLSSLLRPLNSINDTIPSTNNANQSPTSSIKMPSYVVSMTLGHAISDPIDGGILTLQASKGFYEYFLVHMNAKWEYILDPRDDTHDDVRRHSPLLFTTVLFCSSKFAGFVEGRIVSDTDPFLQTRLCSLARNLVIKTLAEGNRSIETMQALYLLACWKDGDDDVSYLHSGYAFRVLQDMDLRGNDAGSREMARRRRIWLALYRQDKQQSLFFMRRSSFHQGDEAFFLSDNADVDTLLIDTISRCSADLRRIQSKLRGLVENTSSLMLPCLEDLVEEEISTWRSKWNYLVNWDRVGGSGDIPSVDHAMLFPDRHHLQTTLQLLEQSVRLNVASAMLRQSLVVSLSPSSRPVPCHQVPHLDIDLSALRRDRCYNLAGLRSGIEGAFGTLRALLSIPQDDLRRAPDAILLLAPSAALFLCLLLCLPDSGMLGPSFQRKAASFICRIAQYMAGSVRSHNDSLVLHSAYLDSVVNLLGVPAPENGHPSVYVEQLNAQHMHASQNDLDIEYTTNQPTQGLADNIGAGDANAGYNDDGINGLFGDAEQNIPRQSLVNLLEGDLFWDIPATTSNVSLNH
ncbi:hypothetical protein ASPTUDRAFT_78725 [Aspergillus tubingensis CBS 134.48]|uniref:Zn(2)-C6 fungal-type domain-containing protein n=1 Tax=Aspergillus tubingensis (strain CBS 134.48) TaxID=767770 RepID=A0A1L9MQI4_ASPTC|nr:hypothetical protein ASPTUDRAFT_78725 [Aspergillus tubingensis CBS 134.48]